MREVFGARDGNSANRARDSDSIAQINTLNKRGTKISNSPFLGK